MKTISNFYYSGIFILSMLLGFSTNAQVEQTRNWLFGNQVHMQTGTGSPTFLTTGGLVMNEGTICQSDATGNLLFFSDGVEVFDQIGNSIGTLNPNVGAGTFSAELGISIQDPGNPNLYYLFTVSEAAPNCAGVKGLHYFIVDVIGPSVTFGGQLMAECTEGITAVRNSNGNDVWVIAHDVQCPASGGTGNTIFAFPVTNTGVGAAITSTHNVHQITPTNIRMQLKANPAGTRLAMSSTFLGSNNYNGEHLFLFGFNPANGQLSTLPMPIPGSTLTYGVEFTISDQYMYYTETFPFNLLYRVDLTNIGALPQLIASYPPLSMQLGDLQLTEDCSIIMTGEAQSGPGLLIEITDVDNPVAPTLTTLNPAPGLQRMGLPTFPPYLFDQNCEQDEVFCALIDDLANGEDCFGRSIISESNGGYAIVGHGGETPADRDMMLSEYDAFDNASFDLKWSANFANENQDESAFDIVEGNGVYFAVGNTANVVTTGGNATDVVVTRINKTTMMPDWNMTFDFENEEFATKVLDLGNELLVIGRTRSVSGAGWRMLMLRVNAINGQLIDQASYGLAGTTSFWANDVTEVNSQIGSGLRQFVIAGEVIENGVRRGMLLRIDELLGNQGHILLRDDMESIGFRAITFHGNRLYVTGYFDVGNDQDLFVAQYTETLQYLDSWTYGIGNNVVEIGRDILVKPGIGNADDELYVCGSRRIGPWNNAMVEDGIILKFFINNGGQVNFIEATRTDYTELEGFSSMTLSTTQEDLLLSGGFDDGVVDQQTFIVRAGIDAPGISFTGCCLIPYMPMEDEICPRFSTEGSMLPIDLQATAHVFSFSNGNIRIPLCPTTPSPNSQQKIGQQKPVKLKDRKTTFSVYPNPAKDVFLIDLQSDQVIKAVNIFNAAGQQMMSRQLNARSIQPLEFTSSGLPAGTYFVELVLADGGKLTERLLISN